MLLSLIEDGSLDGDIRSVCLCASVIMAMVYDQRCHWIRQELLQRGNRVRGCATRTDASVPHCHCLAKVPYLVDGSDSSRSTNDTAHVCQKSLP